MPLKRRAAPRAEIMGWDGSAWQRLPVESSANPNLRTAIYSGSARLTILGDAIDGRSGVQNQFPITCFNKLFNGTNWDRWRNNTEFTVLPSATRTVDGSSAYQTNFNARGVLLFLQITAVSGTFAAGEGLKLWVGARNPATGIERTILSPIGPFTTVAAEQMLIYPGATDIDACIEKENDIPLPRTWRVTYSITGTNPSFTFSIGASYIL